MRSITCFGKQILSVVFTMVLAMLLLTPCLSAAAEEWQTVVGATRLTSAIGDSQISGVAVDGFGNIHIAWHDYRHGTGEIYYTKLDNNGNTLVDDTRLTYGGSSYGIVKSLAPSLGVDSLGNIHIAWTDYRDSDWEIYYTKLDNNGNTLVDDTRLTSAWAQSYSPSLGIDISDNIHITWEDWRDGNPEIYYTKLDNNGNTLIDDTRLTYDSAWSETPELGMDDFDNVHITWREQRDGNREIYYTKLDNNGNTLVDDTRLTFTSSLSDEPKLGVDSSGNVHIAWYDDRDGNQEVYYTKLDNNGNTLVDDARLTYSSGDAWAINLNVDNHNNIHVVWADTRDGNYEIYYTKLDNNGNTLVDDTRLTSDNAYSYYPNLLADNSGDIHIVWTEGMDSDGEAYYTKGEIGTASAVVITPAIGNPTPQQSDTVCVQVNVADVSDLYAASFDLTYDPAVLQFSDPVTEGNFLNQDGQPTSLLATDDPASGKLIVGISRLGDVSGISGAGNLATVCFKVVGDYCSSSAISFTEAVLETPVQDGEISATWNGGTITVKLGTPAAPIISDPGTHDQIDLGWGIVSGAGEYEIHRGNTNSDLMKIATTNGTSYSDSACILPTLDYYYKIVAKSGDTCISDASEIASGQIAGLLGDLNNDGRVNGRDLSILARAFGSSCGDARYNCRADLNRSCPTIGPAIDGDDLSLLAADFGRKL
ncbi:MAG: hypothetical protein HZA78_01955 [Candidatus Schekmanbacteria bacterium]|nr:hypothetical protein [Candidatus Schekmanbacteria bacterium]